MQLEIYEYDYSRISNPLDQLAAYDLCLPAELLPAIKKRKDDFLFGRYCARKALSSFFGLPFTDTIPIGEQGRPVWPYGVVGSITHTKGFAAATVGSSDCYASLGLDAEHIVPQLSDGLLRHICAGGEFDNLLMSSKFKETELLTLIFSAKEALFKLLNPIAKVYFGFTHARVESIDEQRQVLIIELRKDLPQFNRGQRFCIHYKFQRQILLTWCSLS